MSRYFVRGSLVARRPTVYPIVDAPKASSHAEATVRALKRADGSSFADAWIYPGPGLALRVTADTPKRALATWLSLSLDTGTLAQIERVGVRAFPDNGDTEQ